MQSFAPLALAIAILAGCSHNENHGPCVTDRDVGKTIRLSALSVSQEEAGFVADIRWCEGKDGNFLVIPDSGEQDFIVVGAVALRSRLSELSGNKPQLKITGQFKVGAKVAARIDERSTHRPDTPH